MPFLADSRNTTISGGNFVDQSIGLINNNVTTNISLEKVQSGIDILLEASNPDAAHDSSARDYSPRCHPGTRTQYIEDIIVWGVPAVGADEPLPLFWMKGLAGVGKSAIAQTCAERFKDLGRLGATFFFAVDVRDDAEQFFPTIAYQLSMKFPDYRDIVDQRVRYDRTIINRTMAAQFQELIVEPFQELERIGKGIGKRMVIIVDGLDECKKADGQCSIINTIATAARDGATPLCWAFFSRPEPHIESTFTPNNVAQITCKASLPVSDDANSDIELYLRSGFMNILRRRNIPTQSQWPSDNDIQTLVNASKGLFAYAAAVLRDVGQAGSPSEALRAVCVATPNRANSSPFAGLDALYMLIMQRIPPEDRPTVLLLCYLLCSSLSYAGSGTSGGVILLGNILGLSEIDFRATCNHLSAVLHIHDNSSPLDFTQFGDTDRHFQYAPPTSTGDLMEHVITKLGGSIYFYHKSFYDFLIDSTRSGIFHAWSSSMTNARFKRYLEVILECGESYRSQGSGEAQASFQFLACILNAMNQELILVPGVVDSASSLSWPYTNELVNSMLKACNYERAFNVCFQLCYLPQMERQLLQRFSDIDFCKARQNQVMLYPEHNSFVGYLCWGCDAHCKNICGTRLSRVAWDEFRENFNVARFKAAVKRWKACGIIEPYHPSFCSRLKSLVAKKSQDKLISGLFRMGRGPKSIFWYWEINFKEDYYQQFSAVNLAEGERIYREERFDLWPTESWLRR